MCIVMILAGVVLSASAANTATCPATHHGRPLEHVTVFDGPPKDMASLRPEDGREVNRKLRQTWKLAGIRQVHVECGYKGGVSQVVKPPKSTKACTQDLQRLNRKGDYRLLSFGCR
jgi:hypothetical protein